MTQSLFSTHRKTLCTHSNYEMSGFLQATIAPSPIILTVNSSLKNSMSDKSFVGWAESG